MSENNDINNPVSDDNPDEPDDSETTPEDVPSFTNIINGLQNMINVVNLQADTNYANQNIQGTTTNQPTTTTNSSSFNPYINLDSMTQNDNSIVFDFSLYPDYGSHITNNIASDIQSSDAQSSDIVSSDISGDFNTEYTNFTNHLMNYINNSLSNINVGDTSLTQALQQSFVEKEKYKQVISDLGKRQIMFITFPNESCEQTSCPITQEEFLKDQEISQLPCGHCFNSDAIMNWLENEKSECPICRLKLDSKEVKIEEETPIENEEEPEREEEENNEEENESLFTPEMTQQLLRRVMNRAYDNRIQQMQEQEDDELQRAIMASLEESKQSEDNQESQQNTVTSSDDTHDKKD